MRILLRPRWLIVHVLVLGLVVLMVNLGFWQLRRLDERRADNALIAANLSAQAEPLEATLREYGNDPKALAYRRVIVEGTYRPADEVLLTPRSIDRRPGHHVVTPLQTGDATAVLVNRGWVPFEMDVPPVTTAAPPGGKVTVSGILLPTQEATRYGNRDAGGDRITFLSTVDVDLLQSQVDITLQPFSILLQDQQPGGSELPIPAQPPEQSEGSHQSYAWQWFSFATIAAIGYPLLLRRSLGSARTAASEEAAA